MALTGEILRANTATAALTDEQISAIVELSRNDEATVVEQRIGQKTGEIYGGLDADILTASGIAKNGTEKTYDYARRVIGDFRTKAESYEAKETELQAMTREKERLEGIIAKGGHDSELTKQLQQARADLAAVTKDYTDLKAKHDKAAEEHAQELFGVRLDSELERATGAIKFKADLPDSVTRVLVANAKTAVRGMTPEYIDNGAGGKVLVFKDNTGAVMRNPNNGLNPYTASELMLKTLGDMGVLEMGRQMTGTGSQGGMLPGSHGGGAATIDLSGARTQSEADDKVTQALLAQGLTIASDAFHKAKAEVWKANEAFIKSLPIR